MMEEVDNIVKMIEFVCLAGSRTLCNFSNECSRSEVAIVIIVITGLEHYVILLCCGLFNNS